MVRQLVDYIKMLKKTSVMIMALVLSMYLMFSGLRVHAVSLPSASDLALWLKADAGITSDVNNKVSIWRDQSGRGNDLIQSTSAKMPLFVSDAVNGHPVVRFDGADDALEKTLSTAYTGSSSVIMVMKVNRVGQTYSNGIFTTSINANSNSYAIMNDSGNPGKLRLSTTGGGNCAIDASVPTDYKIVSVVVDVTKGSNSSTTLGCIKSYENRVQFAISDNSAFKNFNYHEAYALGRSYRVPPYYMDADVAEILVYQSALSDADRQVVENYIFDKYFKYTMSNITYTYSNASNGPSATPVAGGNVIVNATLNNNDSTPLNSASFIATVYSGSMITSVQVIPVTSLSNGSPQQVTSSSLELPGSLANAKIKLFFWDGISSMKPLNVPIINNISQ